MRLSSRLSDKSQSNGEVETFIDWAKYTMTPEDVTDEVHLLSTGDFVEIQIGRITLPFYSTTCDDSVTFISPKRLHCLIVNDTMISIDCQLQCMDYDEENPKCRDCNPCVQAWFLVGVDDLSVPFPRVNIVKQNFKLPDAIKLPIETADKFSEWLGKAEIAYRERLGAGSIIYLRAAFERITIEVGESAGADIYNKKGNLKTFRDVLIAVDEKCSIIPVIYSDNGYELFKKLSNIAHGNSDEETALRSFKTLPEISENCDRQRKPITKGNRQAGVYPYYGASGVVDHVADYIFDGDYLLVSEDGANLLARSTPIAFSISGKNWVNNHAHVLKFNFAELQKYVEIYLNSIDLSKYISGGAQPKLNQDNLNRIPIPVPSDDEVKRIVGVLTKFDTLCNDLTSGLPAEIEARQKQYEYYRDKLLTFKETNI